MYKGPLEIPDPRQQGLETRTVLFFGEVTPELTQTVAEQLLLLASQSAADIKLVVNAQGGSASDGEALYDIISGIGARVKAIGAGAVSYAAAIAFVAPPVAQRFCLPHARFSIHQNFGSAQTLAGLDLPAAADELARHRRRLYELFARRTNQPLDAIVRASERPLWLTAAEALPFGLVSRIIHTISDV